jgi:hypothetical protein
MDNLFPELGIPWNFVQLATFFLLMMLVVVGIKDRKYLWLNYFVIVIFVLQSLVIILFHGGLQIKLFAALLLASALLIDAILIRNKNRTRFKKSDAEK